MTLGLVGKKCGMTRVFTEAGDSIPVTVIEVLPNRIAQLKSKEIDGYDAVQITYGSKKANKLTKAIAGHFAKAKVEPGVKTCEFRLSSEQGSELKVGDELTVTLFQEGQKVDLRSLTRGKGFAGVIKRHHFATQDATHGNSLSHRAPGSIGQNQSPGRVMKGKKMAGHMGNVNRTIQHQEIIKIDADKNIILVKGAAPGAPGAEVIIKHSVKTKKGDK